ncbi:MAG: radical SAM protein [Planctomycetes bacterium]|nr:radical SAM protein [Planctomycetota bacterium]
MTAPPSIPVPAAFAGYRRVPLDGALLLFDRDTGWNAKLEGPETAHLRQRAPRYVQFAITNRCNLACTFCSRDLHATSGWTADTAFALLRDLAAAGVVEVAFGGGEPFAFPGFVELVRRLYRETPLAVSITTNGTLLDDVRMAALRGCIGQLRLSLYDDTDWPGRVEGLRRHGVRFGVNYLVTPPRAAPLHGTVLDLAARGCDDVLLLTYKGRDASLHLSETETRRLADDVTVLHRALGARVRLGLDVCFGERMATVPQILRNIDCGAGRDFVVVTSDRRLAPCSFHDVAVPFADAAELLALWTRGPAGFAAPAPQPGCARRSGIGLGSP